MYKNDLNIDLDIVWQVVERVACIGGKEKPQPELISDAERR